MAMARRCWTSLATRYAVATSNATPCEPSGPRTPDRLGLVRLCRVTERRILSDSNRAMSMFICGTSGRSGATAAVSMPEVLSTKIRSRAILPSWRSVFWSIVLTRIFRRLQRRTSQKWEFA